MTRAQWCKAGITNDSHNLIFSVAQAEVINTFWIYILI